MNQGKALYELQQIDLTLIQHQKRLQSIAEQLADNAAVQAAQAVVHEAETTLKPLRTKLRDIELQVQSTRSKRESTEKRLYSGSVTNPKELSDMQNEIESLKKWLSELEDRNLEAMVEVEDSEAVLADAQSTLAQVMNNAAAENQDLLSEKQRLESEVSKFQQKRVDAVKVIDASHLQLYESLRSQKANQPIAHLTSDDTCSVCGIGQMGIVIKEIRRGEDIVYCKNCKRILVAV